MGIPGTFGLARRLLPRLLAAMLGAAVVCAGAPFTASGQEVRDRVVRSESFDGAVVDRWRLAGAARVAVEGAQRVLTAERFSTAVCQTEPLMDFVLEFRYRHGQGIADVCLSPRGEEGQLAESLYRLAIGQGAIRLLRATGERKVELAAVRRALTAGAWVAMVVRRSGSQFEVLIDGASVLTARDGGVLPIGLVGFGSVVGEGFAFDDVRIRGGLAAGQTMHGLGERGGESGWRLGRGSRFGSVGRHKVLEIAPGAVAEWQGGEARDYTLAFRVFLEGGKATASFQRSGEMFGRREYRLDFGGGRVSLIRAEGAEQRVLGAGAARLAADRWHDVAVIVSAGWLRVLLDNVQLIKAQDPIPLPPGGATFQSTGGSKAIKIADVKLTKWSVEQAGKIHGLLSKHEKDPGKPQLGPAGPPLLRGQAVMLRHEPYGHPAGTPKPLRPIRPGHVPPNFMHTWILDVKGIDKFRFYSPGNATIKLAPGDRVTIWSPGSLKQNPPTPLADIGQKATYADLDVDISGVQKDAAGRRRIFVQLETSDKIAGRQFDIDALQNLSANTGTEEILVFGDDLNYDEANIAMGIDRFGKPAQIPTPFSPGPATNMNEYPLPTRQKGWYLVGHNLADPSPKFYFLAYYSEWRGKLLLYLYNIDMPMDVSGGTVKLSLWRMGPGAPAALEGAFFPLHPNPHKWSSTTLPLVSWKYSTWACMEVPMLYPMGGNVPVDTTRAKAQPAHWYRSLYEEPLQKDCRSILFRVEIDTYDYATLDLTMEGKAVGDAIQKAAQEKGGFAKLIDIAKAGAKAGGDIYSGGKEIYESVKKFYDGEKQKAKDSGGGSAAGSAFAALGAVVKLGSGVFSGGFGAAGAAFGFIDSVSSILSGGPQPLQLSIELDIMGTVSGTFKVQHSWGTAAGCYLPGRFSIEEGRARRIGVGDPAAVGKLAPRYDRPLGLFGYRYNPGLVSFRVFRLDYPSGSLADFVYPCVANPDLNVLKKSGYALTYRYFSGLAKLVSGSPSVDRLLPLVYNEYAEIIPMSPAYTQGDSYVLDEAKQYPYMFAPQSWFRRYRWYCNFAWSANVAAEPKDTGFPHNITGLVDHKQNALYIKVYPAAEYLAFPPVSTIYSYGGDFPDGLLLQMLPMSTYVPSTYRGFKDIKNIAVRHWYSHPATTVDSGVTTPFDKTDPFPLRDVVFHWDLYYFYYGRTRKTVNQDGTVTVPRYSETAKFRSPVLVDLYRCQAGGTSGAFNPIEHYANVKSRLLVK